MKREAMQPAEFSVSGLYLITPDENDTSRLLAMVEAALAGGARVVQYRNKAADTVLAQQQSAALLALCRRHAVPLIINDDIELCLAIGADGVHLGAGDGCLREARSRLGAGKILGASCYGSLANALQAQDNGADYVAFGACFASATKPQAPRAALSLFGQARDALTIPRVAIGGITPENADQVINAGADALAVIGAVFSSPDIRDTSRRFSLLFEQTNHHDLTQPATL
jgi:thiamine-phosphate pyrophosphorylase